MSKKLLTDKNQFLKSALYQKQQEWKKAFADKRKEYHSLGLHIDPRKQHKLQLQAEKKQVLEEKWQKLLKKREMDAQKSIQSRMTRKKTEHYTGVGEITPIKLAQVRFLDSIAQTFVTPENLDKKIKEALDFPMQQLDSVKGIIDQMEQKRSEFRHFFEKAQEELQNTNKSG